MNVAAERTLSTPSQRPLLPVLVAVASAWLLFGLLYAFRVLPHHMPGLTLAVGGVHLLLALVSLRCAPSLDRYLVHVLASLTVAGLIGECVSAGREQAFAIWFFTIVPVMVAYVGTPRGALVWGLLCAGAVLFVHGVGVLFPRPPPPESEVERLLGRVVLLAIVTTFGALTRRLAFEREGELAAARDRAIKQAQELAEARDEAVAAAKVKATFLANMSHELRTPLNAVIGTASLLRETDLSEEQREYVETIDESSQALLSLISDVLDFSKLEAGKLEAESMPFDLLDVVDAALDMVSREADKKKLELVCVYGEGLPERVVGDAARTKQVLVNLLANAVKFTAQGEVVLTTSVEREGDQAVITFSVRDTGIGIPRDKRDKLFKPFSQVDASTTREFGGTGLGLAISSALAQLLRGKLSVESELGKGSCFAFSFPATVVAAKKEGPEKKLREGFRGRSVLVVDDHPVAREALAQVLRRAGARVDAVASEPEVLVRIAAHRFEVMFVDAELGPESGLSLVSHLATRDETKDTRIVLMSRRGALKNVPVPPNVVARLSKPIKLERLAGACVPMLLDPWTPVLLDASAKPNLLYRDLSAEFSVPRTLNILLAEDNAVVQRVTETMLTRLGQKVTVVSNGQEAIDALKNATIPYDVLLMDVQMPVLDGLAATRIITEMFDRKQRPRIIGLSANALPGDKEACLAAGMDAFLAKPIQLGDLEHALFGKTARKRSAKSSLADVVDAAVIEELRRADGGKLLSELVTLFSTDAPASIERIMQAAKTDDWAEVARIAHRLKGAAGTLGAVGVYATLAHLEGSARSADAENARAALQQVDEKVSRAIAALSRLTASD